MPTFGTEPTRSPGCGSISRALLGSLLCFAGLLACSGSKGMPSPEALASMVSSDEPELQHTGPAVELGDHGPARFVRTLFNGFRERTAMANVAKLDEHYRTPGSRGFEAGLDLVEDQLRAAGFGTREGLELKVLKSVLPHPAWTALSAELRLSTSTGGEAILHTFERSDDLDRCMLPANSMAADVEGPVCLQLTELKPGDIFVTKTALRRDIVKRALKRGACAVISASLGHYNDDPSGRERHLDAIRFSSVDVGIELPVAQISSRSYQQIQTAMEAGGARLSFTSKVELGGRETRTLVATIVGSSLANEVVALSSHLEAPGASDNATGAAGQLENAITLARVLEAGGLSTPARSLAFIWGQENQEATDWLRDQDRKAIAAVNAVMIGESFEKTGARPLLERYPDPGALVTVAPDEHTIWGSRAIEPQWLAPNGLSIIARCAMVDVSQHVGGWKTFENPYEGGTDHERFITSGVPAVLFWHFTDFTFHTSLDRLEMVDSAELKRMAVAALATAMALADPRPEDLTRYLRSVDRERQERVDAALAAGEDAVAEDWRTWCTGVRKWFRVMCLHLEGEEGRLPGAMRSLSLEETTE